MLLNEGLERGGEGDSDETIAGRHLLKYIRPIGSHISRYNSRMILVNRHLRKKESGGCSRAVENFKYPSWRVSKVCERIYTRGCERVRVHRARRSRHASEIVRIRPTIHRDFRQLA